MRRCEHCRYSVCVLGPHPKIPDVWKCIVRGGQIQLHPVLRAMTCRAYECRYRLRIGGANDGS